MKTHEFTINVYIFDTDCYGVMWHGAYTKWLERGRVDFLREQGIEMPPPNTPGGYIYPVAEQHFRFRSPSRMNEKLLIQTEAEVKGPRILFHQRIENLSTGKTAIEATTTCPVLDEHWKPFRRIPEELVQAVS